MVATQLMIGVETAVATVSPPYVIPAQAGIHSVRREPFARDRVMWMSGWLLPRIAGSLDSRLRGNDALVSFPLYVTDRKNRAGPAESTGISATSESPSGRVGPSSPVASTSLQDRT